MFSLLKRCLSGALLSVELLLLFLLEALCRGLLVSQFSTAGCADRLIALVGHGTGKCVIASDTSRVRVLLLLGKAPFGVLRCLIVVFRLAVVVVGVVVVRFLDLELF